MARWPQLVPSRMCKTKIEVEIELREQNENGTLDTIKWKGRCNYQDISKRVYTSEKSYIDVTGNCLIPGDIAPELDVISSGTVKVFGIKRILYLGMKARNPDGTVNYTKLELR